MHEGIASFFSTFRQEGLALIVDDTPLPPRAVLVAPAGIITESTVNRMLHLSGGLMFVGLSSDRTRAFMLSPMARPVTSVGATSPGNVLASPDGVLPLCTSVEAREGVTTGISAADRATTLRILGETPPSARKLVRPGHIFPVVTRDGGCLVRAALPEAALDTVRLAGFTDAAAFMEMVDKGGDFTTMERIERISTEERIPTVTLEALIRHRLETEPLVTRFAEAKLPTELAGELRAYVYKSSIHEGEHLALVKGEIRPDEPVLVRVQPEFTFSDVFGGGCPPSRWQLHQTLKAIGHRKNGVLLYLRRATTGQLKEQVTDWEQYRKKPGAMMREYGLGAQILRDIGVGKIELLTSSAKQLAGLHTFGIEIVAQLPLQEADGPPTVEPPIPLG